MTVSDQIEAKVDDPSTQTSPATKHPWWFWKYLRRLLWLGYGAFFAFIAHGAVLDGVSLGYNNALIGLSILANVSAFSGIILYALQIQPARIKIVWKWIFPIIIIDFIIGLVLDGIVLVSEQTTGVEWLALSAVLLLIVFPSFYANYRLAYKSIRTAEHGRQAKHLTRKSFLVATSVLLVVTLVVGGIMFAQFKTGFTSRSYQHDADIVRITDLRTIGGWIQEYHDKKGAYPLQSKSAQVNYVYIASRKQQQYTTPGPPYPHTVTPLEEFRDDLERVLKRDIVFPFDPQHAPVNKPNFYIYMIRDKTYFLAVHLHQPYSFAREVGPNYYKLEISNVANLNLNVWEYETLMANSIFNEACEEPFDKKGYFDQVRREQDEEQK